MEITYRRKAPARKSCENCGRRNVRGSEHTKKDGTPCKFVLVYRTYFNEDMVHDGDLGQSILPDGKFGPGPQYTYEVEDCTPSWASEPEDNPVKLAIDAIRDADCAYDEGADWFYHCDGSYVSWNLHGMRVEPSAHLYGFSEEEEEHIHTVIRRAWKRRYARAA
ncbi:hypothetical protein ACFZCP_14370 [Streptomyces sp. NPDC007971]|uniref:hypothetical protein n=1 Tax=Streptomyces sp. NPDC007971 TaxID=3364799 RepID=UPI0036E7E456